MATIDFLRDRLIDKLLTIDDKELLEALDQLLRSKINPEDKVKLTDAQHRMLQLSEDDIKYGRTISQEQMDKEDLDWLDGIFSNVMSVDQFNKDVDQALDDAKNERVTRAEDLKSQVKNWK